MGPPLAVLVDAMTLRWGDVPLVYSPHQASAVVGAGYCSLT